MDPATITQGTIEVVDIGERENDSNDDIKNETNEVDYKNIFYVIIVILCCILFSVPTILIPQHDTIKYPNYWYEGMINFHLTYPIHWICIVYMSNEILLQVQCLTSVKSFATLYVVTSFGMDITYCIGYLIWTFLLGLNWPIPFLAIVNYVGVSLFLFTLWYQFPYEMRIEPEGRKKIKSYLLSGVWVVFVAFQYQCYAKVFQGFPAEIQWILAFVLPMALSCNKWAYNRIVKSCSVLDEFSVKMYYNIVMNTNHALFIAIMIGSSATQGTTYCFFLVKFLTDLYHCYKITRIQKKIMSVTTNMNDLLNEKEQAVSLLALIEILEVVIPLEFMVTFLIAYYGPNSSILGNIGSSRWHFKSVQDISNFVVSISQMFIIDLSSGIIIGIILWKMSSINLFKTCCKIMKIYWPWMAIRTASLTSKVTEII